jgi:dephospho-CoA kinase
MSDPASPMIRVGLTGGIASGKTFVCRLFESKGCTIIDADTVAHRLILRGQPSYEPVLKAFGSVILGAGGEIDRAKLGAIVFSDRVELERLNDILHPEVVRVILSQLGNLEREQPSARVIVDASLMIESGFFRRFQKLIVVSCTLRQQIDRLRARNHLSEADARQRIALQMPLEEKVRFGDYVIDNSGTPENTRAKVEALLEVLERTVWTTSR